jgi:hypothetical protein
MTSTRLASVIWSLHQRLGYSVFEEALYYGTRVGLAAAARLR